MADRTMGQSQRPTQSRQSSQPPAPVMAVHAIRVMSECPAALDTPIPDYSYPANVEILDGLFDQAVPMEYDSIAVWTRRRTSIRILLDLRQCESYSGHRRGLLGFGLVTTQNLIRISRRFPSHRLWDDYLVGNLFFATLETGGSRRTGTDRTIANVR